MAKKVRKAIIPAAGYGTRFLPATKAQPKEMLPLVDKPIIQYVVEDAVSAGIEDIIIVTGWHKRNIEDHFDYPFELEKRLEDAGKQEELEEIRRIANLANFHYLRQKGPLGNATPIWNARTIVGDEPFLVLWADDIFEASPTRSQQLVKAYEELGGSAVLASMRANKPEDYKRYGYAISNEVRPGVLKISEMID
jgi:UTP--glucose-1-phosphate uridylyltransferase